jgi:hypothetical protein
MSSESVEAAKSLLLDADSTQYLLPDRRQTFLGGLICGRLYSRPFCSLLDDGLKLLLVLAFGSRDCSTLLILGAAFKCLLALRGNIIESFDSCPRVLVAALTSLCAFSSHLLG